MKATAEHYFPGDLMIICSCGRRLGRCSISFAVRIADDPDWELYCPACRTRTRPILRQPPPEKVVRNVA